MRNIKKDKKYENTKFSLIKHRKERGLPGTSFQQQIKKGKQLQQKFKILAKYFL